MKPQGVCGFRRLRYLRTAAAYRRQTAVRRRDAFVSGECILAACAIAQRSVLTRSSSKFLSRIAVPVSVPREQEHPQLAIIRHKGTEQGTWSSYPTVPLVISVSVT